MSATERQGLPSSTQDPSVQQRPRLGLEPIENMLLAGLLASGPTPDETIRQEFRLLTLSSQCSVQTEGVTLKEACHHAHPQKLGLEILHGERSKQ